MVYKKYIKKDGKIYGPYYYHSKRVDGKVVSEYHGSRKKTFSDKLSFNSEKVKKIGIFIFGFLFLIFMIYFLINIEKGSESISGFSVLNLNANYEDKLLDGNLQLKINQGELIPADSKIVFENSGKRYRYDLSDLITDERISGDFFVSGRELSGNGPGFGLPGEKRYYPDVYFTLNIISSNTSESENQNFSLINSTENQSSGQSQQTQDSLPINSDISNQEKTSEINQNKTNINTEIENKTDSEQNKTQENQTIKTINQENNTSSENKTQINQTNINETFWESQELAESNNTLNESFEDVLENEIQSLTRENQTNPVTGSIISGMLKTISDFFLSLTPTGNVVSSSGKVTAKVSAGNDFILNLPEGTIAELIPGSVYTDSENLSDNEVSLSFSYKKLIVITDYYKSEKGFGQEYLGNNEKTINIDLSNLNLSFNPGELNVSVQHNNQELISLSAFLSSGEISANKTNESINISNETLNQMLDEKIESAFILTDEDREILRKEFPNSSVEVTKAVLKNNRIFARYELEDYWFEATYNSNLSNETLNKQMQSDKTKWLKDIVNKITENKTSETEISGILGEYGF